MKIKCTCEGENCKKGFNIYADGIALHLNDSVTTRMYIDANTLVQIIQEARKALIELTNDRTE